MESDLDVADGHMQNMGKMIEEMENKLRNGLNQVVNPLISVYCSEL
jgi:hypothetical protein